MVYGDAVYGDLVYANAVYGGDFAPPADPATVTVICDELRKRVRYLGPVSSVLVVPSRSQVEILTPRRTWIRS
jgi:hypothetical protein